MCEFVMINEHPIYILKKLSEIKFCHQTTKYSLTFIRMLVEKFVLFSKILILWSKLTMS